MAREVEYKTKNVEVKCVCGKTLNFCVTNRIGPYEFLSDQAFEKSAATLATKTLMTCPHKQLEAEAPGISMSCTIKNPVDAPVKL